MDVWKRWQPPRWRRTKASFPLSSQLRRKRMRPLTSLTSRPVRAGSSFMYKHRSLLAATSPAKTMLPINAYKRMDTIDLEEQIDLSGKTEKEIKAILKELDRRYRVNMVSNAQLDNEKQALYYQVEEVQLTAGAPTGIQTHLLNPKSIIHPTNYPDIIEDNLDDETESKHQAAQELKNWNRSIEEEKRKQLLLDLEIDRLKNMILDRDQLIKESNFVLVSVSASNGEETQKSELEKMTDQLLQCCKGKALQSLDEKIQKLITENDSMKSQIAKERRDLSELREDNITNRRQPHHKQSRSTQSNATAKYEREQQQEIAKHQQEVSLAHLKIDSLENQLFRLETQMHRYRDECEASEITQQQLKTGNRKISRELDESQRHLEEINIEYKHLQIRVDKVKSARVKALNATPS